MWATGSGGGDQRLRCVRAVWMVDVGGGHDRPSLFIRCPCHPCPKIPPCHSPSVSSAFPFHLLRLPLPPPSLSTSFAVRLLHHLRCFLQLLCVLHSDHECRVTVQAASSCARQLCWDMACSCGWWSNGLKSALTITGGSQLLGSIRGIPK